MSCITDENWRPSLMTRVELHDIVLNERYWGFVVSFTTKHVKIQLVDSEIVKSDRDCKVIKPKWDSLDKVVIAKYYKGKYRCWGVKMNIGFVNTLALYNGDVEHTVHYHD